MTEISRLASVIYTAFFFFKVQAIKLTTSRLTGRLVTELYFQPILYCFVCEELTYAKKGKYF